jgi:predicted Abi (CAAX) family protease
MVFMPLNEATSSLTQVTIYQALEKWLGSLIIVNEVEVKSQESTLYIEIKYTIRSRGEKRYLNLEVNF